MWLPVKPIMVSVKIFIVSILELSNTTSIPQKIYVNEGVAQFLFMVGDEECEVSYKDRGGKYQGQRGITHGKV